MTAGPAACRYCTRPARAGRETCQSHRNVLALRAVETPPGLPLHGDTWLLTGPGERFEACSRYRRCLDGAAWRDGPAHCHPFCEMYREADRGAELARIAVVRPETTWPAPGGWA